MLTEKKFAPAPIHGGATKRVRDRCCGNFRSVSDQKPDLAIQDLQNIFPARFSDPRPDFSKTAVTLEKQSYHRAHDVLIHLLSYFRTD